jgi:drug/metabolite transporter (DMT)-like permease
MLTIIGAFAFLSSGILANKVILKALPPIFFVGIRMFLSGVVIFASNWKKITNNLSRLKEDIIPLLFICLCTTFIPSYFKAYALQNMASGKATLLGSIDPFITAIYVYFLCNEKINFRKFIGMVIGFTGVAILVSSHTPLESTLNAFSVFSWPELAAIAAVIISRGGWLTVQKLVRNERYSPIEINGIAMLGSGIASLIAAAFAGQLYTLPGANIMQASGAMLYTIVGGNIIGYTMYAYALKHYSATLVSISGFSIPIFVAVGAYFMLGEPITMYTICSAAIMFTGIAIFHSSGDKSGSEKKPKRECKAS